MYNRDEIPEQYAKYFNRLDTPALITDLNLRVVWKNDAVKQFRQRIRRFGSVSYYLHKPHFAALKRLQPGETMSFEFLVDEFEPAFARRMEDCYIFRISRYDAAAQKRISELFNRRYNSSGTVAAPSFNISTEPFPQISGSRLDRLAAIFEGLYSENLVSMDITVPLAQFARQATCALYGIKVVYSCDSNFIAATFNVADLFMALAAMTACAITYAPAEDRIYLECEKLNSSVEVRIKCRNTGFASNLIKVYKNYEDLDVLCEYGAHYLNLLLINILCEHYDWYFDIREDGEFTYFSITLSSLWDGGAPISLFEDEYNDEFANILLLPFRKNPKD